MAILYKIKQPYSNAADSNRAAWVAKMMAGSESTAAKIGISPEAIVAQAALESGWGRSAIGNNVFGIKADKSWTGPKQLVHTREVINGQDTYIDDWFRDYASVELSIEDHFKFLVQNTRYRDAGVFDKKGDLAYFSALQRAGYATDPNYAMVLSQVLTAVKRYTSNMERVDLGAYSVDAGGNVKSVPPAESTTVKDSNKGITVAGAAGVAAATTPLVSAFGGLDWRVAAVLGAVTIVCIIGAVVYFTRIKKTRVDMGEKGIL